MAHLIKTALYSAREGAGWTGLGQTIPAAIARDPRAMAELLGATYTVEKRECYYRAADGSFQPVDGREVLVRADTGAMLEVVSDSRYHVDNRQPIDMLEAFRDELAKESLEISHAAVLDGGRKIAVCALLREEGDLYIGKRRDHVKNYVTLSTGYDKKHGTKATLGTVRVVCANTLAFSITQAQKEGSIKTIKASQAMEFDSLKNLLSTIGYQTARQQRTFDALANAQMSDQDVTRFFCDILEVNIADLGRVGANGSKLVSTKAENTIRELAAAYANAPGAQMATGTAWGALNAVTYYATHLKTVRNSSGEDTTAAKAAARVNSNLFGDAGRLKVSALQLLADRVAIAA